MPIAPKQQRRFTVMRCLQQKGSQMVSTTTHFLATLRGTQETMAHQDLLHMEQKPSAASLPTDLACTTCQAMFGSGARIGIAIRTTPRALFLTPQDPRLELTVCCAAATGATAPSPPARRCAFPCCLMTPTRGRASVSRGLLTSSTSRQSLQILA